MAKKKTIYCLAEMAYQFDLKTDLMGGGERYFQDFVSLLKRNDYNVELYQFSYEKQTVYFRGHKIHGLGNIPKIGNPLLGYRTGVEYFLKYASEADGIYLLSMNLSTFPAKIPTITTSHGIFFNHCEKNDYFKPIEQLDNFKKWVRNATHTISVDTDTLHQMAVYWPQNINKMTYIPNYVDLNKFKPQNRIDDGVYRILYPRRLQEARGYHILMKAMDLIFEKYPNIEVIFAGKGHDGDTYMLNQWIGKQNGRAKHVVYDAEDMPNAYKNIDLGVVPTCYSEGTSLSLVELMASKIMPITTWVGGLSDLGISGINSLVIPPNNPEALSEAIEYCINNPEHVQEMRDNGQRMIKHFSKERWEKDILKVVTKIYGESR